ASTGEVTAAATIQGTSQTVTMTYKTNTTPSCESTIDVTVSSFGPMGDDQTLYFCPGDRLTLNGSGQNITRYEWLDESKTPIAGEAGDGTSDSYEINPTVSTTYYFRGCNGEGVANCLEQKFTITRNEDLDFTVTNNIVACKNDAQTLTATATSTNPTNLQYDFGNGYAAANTFALPTATAGTSQTLTVKGKADNFCESSFISHYDIAEFDAQKDNWKSTVYKNDNLELKVTGTMTAPVGYALHYAWEKSTNPAGAWTSVGTDADTYTENAITDAACYRVTVTLSDGTNTLCDAIQLDGCIEVTDIVIGDDAEFFFCPGEPNATITLKGNASGIDGYAWYKEGDVEPQAPATAATEAVDVENQITATESTKWYFKVFSGTNTAKQTFTITRNADLAFSATDNIVACKDDAQTLTATATSANPTNLQYDFGNGYAAANTFALPTAAAGTAQTLTVKGKADNFCESSFTSHYDVAELIADKDGAWAESVFNGESVTLSVTTAGSTIPTGYEVKYAWEKDGVAQQETSATFNDTPTADATYKVTVSIVNSTDNTNVLCDVQEFTTTVKIVNIKMGDDQTLYYCPGDNLTLSGSGNNLTGYAWYKEGEAEPTAATTTLPSAQDVTDATYDLTDIQADTKVYFKGFSGPNSAQQVFTISKHADYKFNLTPATVTTCVNENQPLTINTQKDASIAATGETYYWTANQANMPSTVYPSVDISVPSENAAGTVISITGEIKPATLTPAVKDSRFCPVSKDFNYKVAKIDVEKGDWKEIICKGDNVSLDLVNNSVTPTGTNLSIKWYTKTQTGTWTENTSAKDQITLTLNNVQETTEIKAEIKMMEGTVEHCDIADITGKVQVPNFTVTPQIPDAVGQCYGFPVSFAGNIKVSGLDNNTATYQWSKNGTDIAGAETETYSFTMEDNRDAAADANHTAGTYRLTATVMNSDNAACTAVQDWTLT
ncbi:MAG: hypothetical protein PUG15_00760, partial [Bacteroidales bacterium]|nr:hypothetical protein [Bacteroidales bacterium]